MIQMIQLSKFILLSFIFLSSCNGSSNVEAVQENISYQVDSINKNELYKKIEHLVNIYDVNEDERLRLQSPESKNYSIDDSLCFYMALLDKRELVEDDYFRSLMGILLEKKYLGVRNYGRFDPEFFAVYNASLLYDSRMSNSFALNILLKQTNNLDSNFISYGRQLPSEFYCIDSVILTLDKIPQMQNDPNHLKCMNLVKNNKTGGGNW